MFPHTPGFFFFGYSFEITLALQIGLLNVFPKGKSVSVGWMDGVRE